MIGSDVKLDEIDLLESTWERGVPHDQLALLRRQAPVFWHDVPDDAGFWAITKHRDVRAISRDPYTFSTQIGTTFIRTPPPAFAELVRMMLAIMDPPKHDRFRRLVNFGFTPRMMSALRESVRVRAVELAERVVEQDGEVEFVEDVAKVLPLAMICDLVGVPEEDRERVLAWSNRMIGYLDPEFRAINENGLESRKAFFAYCDDLVEQRRANPREDLITALAHAEVDGDRLSPDEIGAFFVNLTVAGDETARHLIAHAMQALIEHPQARAELAANLDNERLWNSATEEFLRWGTAIAAFRRTATRDTEIRGQRIKEGEKVVLWYMSANRDEEVFKDPYTFDIHRYPNDHVSFGGGGIHYCLGANLSRMEIKYTIRELLRRYPHAELTGPVERMRSDFINGVKRMPVKFSH